MLYFHHSSLINAPVQAVWQFHERSDVLDKLTPPWQPVTVIRREGGLDVGAETEFRLFLGPIPLRWLARHTVCELHHLFTDEQIDGPFDSWVHRHEFEDVQGKTRLTDAIAFSLPGGWLTESLIGWAVMAQLDSLFRYRHRVTRQFCES